jgi:hypothetical protein
MVSYLFRRENLELTYKSFILHFNHPADLLRVASKLKTNAKHLTVNSIALSSKFVLFQDIAEGDPVEKATWAKACKNPT